MSFLGDLVNSIGSDKAPVPQPKPFQRPNTASTAVPSKPNVKAALLSNSEGTPPNPLKRKVHEQDAAPPARSLKVSTPSTLQTKSGSRPATPVANGTKLVTPITASLPPTPSTATSVKVPPKGSYADIMARAKQAQEQRSTSKVGLIKHHATNKEKVSKVAERRREEQERLKSEKLKSNQQPTSRDRVNQRRSASPAKKGDKPKAPKAPRPPLHAPATYKGTIGTAPKHARDSASGRPPKRTRLDEYLGTDEEDEDEDDLEGDDDGYGYASDQSSDMEAGWDELEGEEALALQAARKDDAREQALEAQLKNEKEERRKRLAAMAKRNR